MLRSVTTLTVTAELRVGFELSQLAREMTAARQ